MPSHMHILPPNPKSVRVALSVLERGGIVVYPTETCYGLACDLTNARAVARLFTLKKRPVNQPVSGLFSSIEQAKLYVLWNTQADTMAEKHLPGPLTIILPLRPHTLTPLYTVPSTRGPSANPTVGIRISSNPIAQELVEAFGRPISTTSANMHGRSAAYAPEEIVSQFPNDLSDILLLDGGILPHCPPSQIIDLTGPSPREVRRGDTIAWHAHGASDRVLQYCASDAYMSATEALSCMLRHF